MRQDRQIELLERVAAGFRTGTTPRDVADTVLDALVNDEHRVQRPVGADAKAVYEQRARVSLDEFVALGDDVSDDDYRAWFARNFGIQL